MAKNNSSVLGVRQLQALQEISVLLNAIRFTPDEGSIRVILQASDFGVRVAVSDTGIGIPQGEFGRIFEKFYEVQSAATHSSGTVGLAIEPGEASKRQTILYTNFQRVGVSFH